jgi:hypothetical protein
MGQLVAQLAPGFEEKVGAEGYALASGQWTANVERSFF